MPQNSDIAIAIQKFKDSADRYAKTSRYYKGDHDLCFATEKFKNAFGNLFREFALNLCPAVVDAVKDKLVITEFGIEEGDSSIPNDAWKIWQLNRMGVRAGEIHKEALRSGDSYAIVWPNPATGTVTIYPNRAASCTVQYDEETPGKILWAAKYWKTTDKRFRLNLYYPDRIERYVTKAADEWSVTEKSSGLNWVSNGKRKECFVLPDAKNFVQYVDDGRPMIANPYGIVPVFHFANNSDIGMPGVSELDGAIPIQDALNKTILDMLVAMEFAAYRQRWAAGIEIEYDDNGKPIPPFTAGIERLWVTENPEAKFGDFDQTDLDQFLKVKDSFRVDVACITGTPIWYFMQNQGDFPSGEALRKSETRFTNKIRDRQNTFGQTWEDLMSFALLIENKGKGIRLFAEWEDPSPLSETEELNNLILKQQIGVPEEKLWMEAGYGEADIKEMTAANDAKREKMVKSFNAGEGDITSQ